jgi:hypothetical protein
MTEQNQQYQQPQQPHPQQQPPPKKKGKKKWYFLGGIILLFVFFGAFGSEDGESGESGQSDTESLIQVGESGSVDERRVTLREVSSTQKVDDNQMFDYEASPGATLILATINIENMGSEELMPSSDLFELEDSEGRTFQPHRECRMGLPDQGFSFSQIGPGLSRAGTICFEVPSNAELKQLHFKPNIFSSKRLHFDMSGAL